MTVDTVQTSVGTVPVLHRLALGLVVRDSVRDSAAVATLRVGWEAAGPLLPVGATDGWPCVDFEPMGGARFRLRATPRRPQDLTVRVYDPTRRYVPRRLAVTLWPHSDLISADPARAVAVASRTLPLWLFPGAAHPLPRGTTAVRGRITRDGEPQPWARVTAVDTGGTTLGRAHGDDRGEFLLLLADTNQNPVQSTVDVRFLVRGPAGTPADPPVEPVARPANPPAPGDLDNPVLRGQTPPPGYLANSAPVPQHTVPVGEELVLPDIEFHP